jgi:hypothetical protein
MPVRRNGGFANRHTSKASSPHNGIRKARFCTVLNPSSLRLLSVSTHVETLLRATPQKQHALSANHHKKKSRANPRKDQRCHKLSFHQQNDQRDNQPKRNYRNTEKQPHQPVIATLTQTFRLRGGWSNGRYAGK